MRMCVCVCVGEGGGQCGCSVYHLFFLSFFCFDVCAVFVDVVLCYTDADARLSLRLCR